MTASRNITLPFNRRVELLVWSTLATDGKKPDNVARRFVSDGTREGFYITFDITRSAITFVGNVSIQVRNLNAETRSFLQQGGLRVELRVGWENFPPQTIFLGSIMRSITARQGPDWVTGLSCLSGRLAVLAGFWSITAPPGTRIKDLVVAAAQTFPGVSVDPNLVKIDPAKTVQQTATGAGLSVPKGRTDNILNRLSEQYSFTWRIDNEIFSADEKDGIFGNVMDIRDDDGLLISLSPQCTGYSQLLESVAITTLLIPTLYPGCGINLRSPSSPNLSGTWKLHTIRYTGSANENQWHMRSDCFAYLSKQGRAVLIQNKSGWL